MRSRDRAVSDSHLFRDRQSDGAPGSNDQFLGRTAIERRHSAAKESRFQPRKLSGLPGRHGDPFALETAPSAQHNCQRERRIIASS